MSAGDESLLCRVFGLTSKSAGEAERENVPRLLVRLLSAEGGVALVGPPEDMAPNGGEVMLPAPAPAAAATAPVPFDIRGPIMTSPLSDALREWLIVALA